MADNGLFVPFITEEERNKVGRPRRVKTPKQLEQIFADYVKDREKREIVSMETETGSVGESDINKVKTKRKQFPLSIEDFCVYLGVGRVWWNQLPEEFSRVKERIYNYIFNHQLRGAISGEFNPNIVARQLGLADKKEVATSGDGLTIVVNNKEEKEKLDKLGGLEI